MSKRPPRDVEQTIFHGWNNGLAIRATQASIRQRHGVRVEFEDVRRRFVKLADQFHPGIFR